MRLIYKNKIYDTKTATEIATTENTPDIGNFHHCSETLYRTKKGAWFLYGEGGPLSKYAEHFPGGSTGSEDIIILTDEEAADWLAEHNFADLVLEHFPDTVEEA